MADLTALNQAVQDVKDAVSAAASEMDTLLADLKQAIANQNQAGIDAATQALQDQVQALKDAVTRDAPPAGP